MSDQLDVLRKKYEEAKTATERKHITIIAGKVKMGERFGSVEVGGNGFCYECYLNEARPNHYNCSECSGQAPLKNASFEEMVEKVGKMGGRVTHQPVEKMSEQEVWDAVK